ncbi:hypothetical protein ACQ4PT_042091 [Festuca glaucescens]
MARSGCSSSHGASPSRRRVVHPTPPPLPAVLCYRCEGGTVRTWVVEDVESSNLGKRFYKCPCFHESKPGACRFGFMWHDDYRPILEQLGVIQSSASQNRLTWTEAPVREPLYSSPYDPDGSAKPWKKEPRVLNC